MNIVVTGSLGNISKPLTEILVGDGHAVTVVSSTAERRPAIEAIGARAAIGTMEDAAFLAATFAGADAVYAMETLKPSVFTDSDKDVGGALSQIVMNYKQAIEQSGVKRVVNLSSVGGHAPGSTALLSFYYTAEQTFGQLPADVSITTMRPVGFYTNLFGFIPVIKSQGAIVTNYGGDNPMPWVSPRDIAAAIAEELTSSQTGRKVRYVASEEISCNTIARVLGAAIGKPDLQWIVIPDEQMQSMMIASGMEPGLAASLVEMNAKIRTGTIYADYKQHRPVLGTVTIHDFAQEFARVYNQAGA